MPACVDLPLPFTVPAAFPSDRNRLLKTCERIGFVDSPPSASLPQRRRLGNVARSRLRRTRRTQSPAAQSVRLGIGRDVRSRVVDDVALSAAPVEVVGVLVHGAAESQLDAIDCYPVMAGLGCDAIAGTRDGHVCGLQGRVVRGRESSIRREARDLRVGKITRDQRPHVVELFFRRLMPLNVAACQQLRPGHVARPSRTAWTLWRTANRNGPLQQPCFGNSRVE